MKKITTIVLLLAAVLTFASCGGKFICDGCETEKVGKAHEIKIIGGTAVTMCDDCYAEYEALIKSVAD